MGSFLGVLPCATTYEPLTAVRAISNDNTAAVITPKMRDFRFITANILRSDYTIAAVSKISFFYRLRSILVRMLFPAANLFLYIVIIGVQNLCTNF